MEGNLLTTRVKANTFVFNNLNRALDEICSEVEEAMQAFGWQEETACANYILRELLSNSYKHGNGSSKDKYTRFDYSVTPDRLRFVIQDECEERREFLRKLFKKGMDSKTMTDEQLRDLMISMYKKRQELGKKNGGGGFGIYSAGRFMDRIELAYNDGNIVFMEKYRKLYIK